MSGAGKSQALKIFEDFGFFCIDNMPIQVVLDFIGICLKNPNDKYKNIAISIDSRIWESLVYFEGLLIALKEKNIECKIIFFNASDLVLVRRYSETRHRHPLGESLLEGIMLERKVIDKIFKFADEVVDTTDINVIELKELIYVLIGGVCQYKEQYLNVFVLSFGYKYGVPSDADIIYDVRFLANPNYVRELKFKTGEDEAVKDYVEKQKEFKVFFNIFSELIGTTLPLYVKEGKSYLTIAIGCTGGKHRSVFTAIKLVEFLRNKKYKVKLAHRDIFVS
jgi:UPF0042 nucleotide-binding protein